MKLALLLLCLVIACDTGVDASLAPDGSQPGCDEAISHSDLAWIQDEVFSSCAVQCHRGAALSAGGFNFESGKTESALVNANSNIFPTEIMVRPGDSSASYLMVVLGSQDGPLDNLVGTMPLNLPVICSQKRDAVARWIDSLEP